MKYDKMVAYNREVSREKTERAMMEIKKLFSENKAVSVSALAEKTGLSREFFYKNAQVRDCLMQAREKQSGMVLQRPQKAVLDKAMEARLAALEMQLKKERSEKEELLAQNARLQKSVRKKDLNTLRNL